MNEETKAIEISPDEARSAIEREKHQRSKRVAGKIQAILTEENCEFDIISHTSARGTEFTVSILPK